MTGIVDTIVDSPTFEHTIMNRADGSAIISGDHSIGIDNIEDNLSLPSSEPGILGHMEKFGSHMERFGSHMGRFGSHMGSEMSGVGMQSFDPFSIFGMVRKKWYQGENVCTEREVIEEEDTPERVNVNNNGFGVFQMNMQVRLR